jgi:RNA recognition motif-containing protein
MDCPFKILMNQDQSAFSESRKEVQMICDLKSNEYLAPLVRRLNRLELNFGGKILRFLFSSSLSKPVYGENNLCKQKRTVCVLGIPKEMDEGDLHNIFISFGKIEFIDLREKIDKKTNFCFLTYWDESSAERALKVIKIRSKKFKASLKINKFYGKVEEVSSSSKNPNGRRNYWEGDEDEDDDSDSQDGYIKKKDLLKMQAKPSTESENLRSENQLSKILINHCNWPHQGGGNASVTDPTNHDQPRRLRSIDPRKLTMPIKQHPSVKLSFNQYQRFSTMPTTLVQYFDGPFYVVKRIQNEHKFFEKEMSKIELVLDVSLNEKFKASHLSPVNLEINKC